jgi:hypothetical protein
MSNLKLPSLSETFRMTSPVLGSKEPPELVIHEMHFTILTFLLTVENKTIDKKVKALQCIHLFNRILRSQKCRMGYSAFCALPDLNMRTEGRNMSIITKYTCYSADWVRNEIFIDLILRYVGPMTRPGFREETVSSYVGLLRIYGTISSWQLKKGGPRDWGLDDRP